MKENIYTLEEFIKKAGIDANRLQMWEQQKLIRPVGHTDDQIPFFSSKNLAEVDHILKLEQLGYASEDIEKIIKKVGLPHSKTASKECKDPENYFTVGALAEKAGISPRTIKHWEDKGILIPDMRSEGGFRLYSEMYVYLCNLIQDLQHFGYSLEEIKTVSDYFRDFQLLQSDLETFSKEITEAKISAMLEAIDVLYGKMNLLKEGIQRWEDLIKKKKKEIQNLKSLNAKRDQEKKGKSNA
jgi:DNA-binding transcriptional MerR regulator